LSTLQTYGLLIRVAKPSSTTGTLSVLILLSCPSDNNKNNDDDDDDGPLTLDQRLIGGKWFQLAWAPEYRVYRITKPTDYDIFYVIGYYEFVNDGDDSLFSSVNTKLNNFYDSNDLTLSEEAVYSKTDGIRIPRFISVSQCR
jgi:hypothetical protein